MKISRLVIGTGNPAKYADWLKLLSPSFVVRSLRDFPDIPAADESGDSFLQNAKFKAVNYAKTLHEFVLSEDGGYEIAALGGAPGVHSRRILPGHKEGTDDQLIDFVIGQLKGIPDEKRQVKLTCAVALSDPQGRVLFTDTNSSVGLVARKRGPVLIPGYPFRTIHFLPQLGKTYAELTDSEHEKFNHKKPIAEKIIARFSK